MRIIFNIHPGDKNTIRLMEAVAAVYFGFGLHVESWEFLFLSHWEGA